jgi:hypothetical protein
VRGEPRFECGCSNGYTCPLHLDIITIEQKLAAEIRERELSAALAAANQRIGELEAADKQWIAEAAEWAKSMLAARAREQELQQQVKQTQEAFLEVAAANTRLLDACGTHDDLRKAAESRLAAFIEEAEAVDRLKAGKGGSSDG